MAIGTLGIDFAKNVFALHGAAEAGHVKLRKPAAPRAKPIESIAALPSTLIGMKASSGVHPWPLRESSDSLASQPPPKWLICVKSACASTIW